MATKDEYAQLSLYVYDVELSTGTDQNRPFLPSGWEQLEYQPAGFMGVSYGIFRRTGSGEVVIAYAGTNDIGDGLEDIAAGLGVVSTQTTNAAAVYLNAKQRYGSNITFTGHSLGGGLASVMAVWFDREATVFDEAPFELIARNPWFVPATKAALAMAGLSDPAFTSYTGLLDFSARENNVTNYYVQGEFLSALRLPLNTVAGQDNIISANNADMSAIEGAVDLHSQALLTSMVMSDAFRQSTYASTRIIPLLMDKNLYANDAATSDQQNVLINFIRSEQGTGDKLTHFAADMQKLGTDIAGLNKAAQDALIAQGIEWYYWQSAGYAGQEFFTQTGDLLQYTTAQGEGLSGAQNKAAGHVQKWLTPIVNGHGEFYSSSFANYQQWNVVTGSGGASGTARDTTKSQIFIGGSGADSFTGGQMKDIMFSGDGGDTLSGGDGDDRLYGGLGNDLLQGGNGYDRYAIEGSDTIQDEDGEGALSDRNGKSIAGVIQKREDGSYSFLSDSTIGVTGAADITLTLADGSSVEIKNYQDGDLSLHLYEEKAAGNQFDRTLLGDLAPQHDPVKYDELGNAIVSANVQAGREDSFQDSTGNDSIRSLGGDDFIYSWRGGDDQIEGGDGDDWMVGGMGKDVVAGGAGRDVLVEGDGDDKLYADGIVSVADAIAAQNAAASGLQGEALSGGADNDLAIGGTGDDVMFGGTGDDILIAGAGDDNIDGDAMSANITPNWTVTRTVTTENGTTSYLREYNQFFLTWPTVGGNDAIYAGAGADWVSAGHGNDYVDGGSGDDVLFGEGDSDDLFGGANNDVIIGDGGDTPLSAQGDDYLDGEDGDDKLFGDGGSDMLFGGSGNDKLYADDGTTGAGNDTLDGEDGDDILVGGAKDDQLFGGTGADFLQGDSGTGEGDGDDTLDGEDGDDTLIGEGGKDELYGGAGNDQIAGDHGGYDPSGEADTIFGEAGNDIIDGQGGDDVIDAGADNDIVAGGTGNDLISGGTGDDQLQGGDGDDSLDGGDGTDYLFGETGNDSISGGAGTDYLLGGLGNDTLDGGEGDDYYFYSTGEGIDHISDSGGTDMLVFNDVTWGQVALGTGSLKLTVPGGEIHLDDFDPDNPYAAGGIEYFQFADGAVLTKAQLINALGIAPTGTPEVDVLSGTSLSETIRALAGDDVVTARAGNDTIYADDGADVVYAGTGNDVVYGGAGDDTLLGEAGNDTLRGEAGNDLLSGGAGTDILEGGDGNDSYLFQTGDGQDTATDAFGTNAVMLGVGLTANAIAFSQQGNDLAVSIKNTTDRLTVKDWFAAGSHFETVTLGDGTVLDHAGVDAAMPRNQAPLATADNATVTEDSLLYVAGNALANDSDPEGRALRITNAGSYAGAVGTLTLNGNGAYSYSLSNSLAAVQALAAGQSLTERFAYTVTDDDPAGAATAESAIVVTVQGANDLPVLGSDSASTAEDAAAISGNVLANDRDVDAGTNLTIANAGTLIGSYGSLLLGANGAWSYNLANSTTAVQSLAAGQLVTDAFGINVSDGIAQVGGSLAIGITGQNDAPILVAPLADQSASANSSWTWQVPADSFKDIDAGDVLAYGATLADGTALPSWLSFDAMTQTFSGRVPKSVTGSIDIRVAATDRIGADAADVFTLNFASGTGGGGGGGGGGASQGNEGVGNGVDAAPPGHDLSFNDGAGTEPGSPGAQGGNGYQPPQKSEVVIPTVQLATAMPQPVAHGASSVAPGQQRKLSNWGGDVSVDVATDDQSSSLSASQNDGGAVADSSTAAASADAGFWDIHPSVPALLNSSHWSAYYDSLAESVGGTNTSYVGRWIEMDLALSRALADDKPLSSLDDAFAADVSGLGKAGAGWLGTNVAFREDSFSLLAGNGQGLKTFQGLGQGTKQIA